MGRLEDAGYDLFSCAGTTIMPGQAITLPLGFAAEFPQEYAAVLLDRGSMGLKGIIRRAGLIDSGFRNEWKVCLYNSGGTHIPIDNCLANSAAKAVAQVIFVQRFKVQPELVTELSESQRGMNWKGSTDASPNT